MLRQGLSAARQKLERRMSAQLREAGGSAPELEVPALTRVHDPFRP